MYEWIVITAIIAVHGLFFLLLLALLRGSAPDELTRRLDDEEQIRYLRMWREKKEQKRREKAQRKAAPRRSHRS